MRNNQSFNQLRRVIRGILSEMPFKGVMPTATDKAIGSGLDQYAPDKLWATDTIEKFHSTTKYLRDASNIFKDFPQDIYILPVAGALPNASRGRSSIFKPEVGINLLKSSRIEGINYDELESVLSQGATVIVSGVYNLSPGLLPTAWMILHALLDSEGVSVGGIEKLQDGLHEILSDAGFDDSYSDTLLQAFQKCLTMRSARTGKIFVSTDMSAEIIVQEVGTRAGFQWSITPEAVNFCEENECDIELIESTLMNVENFLKSSGVKQQFISALQSTSGMIVMTQTSDE